MCSCDLILTMSTSLNLIMCVVHTFLKLEVSGHRCFLTLDMSLIVVVSQNSRFKKELEDLKKNTNLKSVDSALSYRQKLFGRRCLMAILPVPREKN